MIIFTIFLLFINSSIAFFFGTIRLVRPLCRLPKIFPSICNTSSDDLQLQNHIKYCLSRDAIISFHQQRSSLEFIIFSNVIYMIYGLLQMICSILNLLQFPRVVIMYCCVNHHWIVGLSSYFKVYVLKELPIKFCQQKYQYSQHV